MTEIIQRSHSTVQHIVERYKKENRLAGKARKSSKKFTAYEAKCILRQIKNNPTLGVTTLVADIENHLHK
jgi:transposase